MSLRDITGPGCTALGLRAAFGPLPPLTELQAQWLELQSRSDVGFFASWRWIGAWIATLQQGQAIDLRLARMQREGQTVALAVFGLRRVWRLGVIPVRIAALHETGVTSVDAVTIEYNGLLARRGEPPEALQALVSDLLANHSAIDECRLSGVGVALGPLADGLQQRNLVRPVQFVDLQRIRESGKDYLAMLGQRQRYLVRKSLKKMSAGGALTVSEPTDLAEARQRFEQMQALHQLHWSRKGEPGAFGSEFQQRFHAALFEQGWPEGSVRLLSVHRGADLVGHFHYFCRDGVAHYYQSGIDYDRFDNADSPGLAAHAVAIEHFLADGARVYDFMAGDHQYKRTMGTDAGEMHWTVLQRRSLKMRLESMLLQQARSLRSRWRERRATSLPARPAADVPATEARS